MHDINLKGTKIMVVDDDQQLSRLMNDVLSAFGAKVSCYNCPLRALEGFTQAEVGFDMVITDQTMPGMTGMQLSESILRLKPNIPIILCTGYSEEATAETTKAMGIAGFFLKPIIIADLVRYAQKLIRV